MKEIILNEGDSYNLNNVQVGVCVFCNGSSLNYSNLELDGDLCYYDWVCDNCLNRGKEYYKLNFIGQNIYVNEDPKDKK